MPVPRPSYPMIAARQLELLARESGIPNELVPSVSKLFRRVLDKQAIDERLNYQWIADYLPLYVQEWTAFTPSLIHEQTSGTPPSLGNGTASGRYIRFGPLLHYKLRIVWGSTTSYGTSTNFLAAGLPSQVASFSPGIESYAFSRLVDTSAARGYVRTAVTWYDASRDLLVAGAVADDGSGITDGTPFTWATGDEYRSSGWVEV